MSASKSLFLENWAIWLVQNFNKDDKISLLLFLETKCISQPLLAWHQLVPVVKMAKDHQGPGAGSVSQQLMNLCTQGHCGSYKILLTSNRQGEKATQRNTVAAKRCKYIWKSIMWFKIWTRVAFETPIFHVSIQPNLSLHMCYQYPFSPLLYTSIYLVLLLTKLDLYVALEESRTVHWSCSSS